jgi:hypothetical protein
MPKIDQKAEMTPSVLLAGLRRCIKPPRRLAPARGLVLEQQDYDAEVRSSKADQLSPSSLRARGRGRFPH